MVSNNGRYKRKDVQPDYDGAITWALSRLRLELPSQLTYHNLWHTEQVVIPAVASLAKELLISVDQQRLITVAAAFHDLGFIEKYLDHETISMRMARENLPGFGFKSIQIDQVVGMIRTTRLPQDPHNLMEEIMADADLDVLGRDDFMVQNNALYEEVLGQGKFISMEDWLRGQIHFIAQHRYFTSAARRMRDINKEKNLIRLREQLAQLETA